MKRIEQDVNTDLTDKIKALAELKKDKRSNEVFLGSLNLCQHGKRISGCFECSEGFGE